MYKIIGADGKEYGPATREQLREWQRQGRINLRTLVRPEAGGDWRPFVTYAELNLGFDAPPLPPPVYNERASIKIPAGICGILIGALGIHKFILGYTGAGLIMLLASVLTCGFAAPAIGLIGLIEGIIYLTKSDEEFVRTYVESRKEWF